MTPHARTPFVLCLAALVAVAASFVPPAAAQSLGEVARQEQARRKSVPAGKRYTNENLPVVPPASTPTARQADAAQTISSSAAASDQGAAGQDEAKASDEKKDEKYWRERLMKLHESLARAESFAEALQSRINALSTDFVNRDDPAQRAVIAADRDKALAELDRVQKEIRDLTKDIETLREEARRQGVPPGWLR